MASLEADETSEDLLKDHGLTDKEGGIEQLTEPVRHRRASSIPPEDQRRGSGNATPQAATRRTAEIVQPNHRWLGTRVAHMIRLAGGL
jgi:hypothetical protein